MKQKIWHGTELDIATPDEVAVIVDRALTARDEHFHREKGAVNLDGTGAGVGHVRVGRGYDWILERITLTAGANALITLFENAQNNSDMLEVVQLGAAGLYSDSFANKLVVPAGNELLIVCSGGGANGQMTFNLQVQMVKAHA